MVKPKDLSKRPSNTSRMWFVYIIKCADDTFYTGITNDLDRRVNKHNNKDGGKYTRVRTPVKLVYKEEYETKSVALKREMQIKNLKKEQKMGLIIKPKVNA